jgi:hypothetical protein
MLLGDSMLATVMNTKSRTLESIDEVMPVFASHLLA